MTVIDAESKLKVERTHLAQQVKERDDKLAQALIECERSATPPPPRSPSPLPKVSKTKLLILCLVEEHCKFPEQNPNTICMQIYIQYITVLQFIFTFI